MQPRTHVTLEDVAKAAEVSLATASRALNGKLGVKPETREAVLHLVETRLGRPVTRFSTHAARTPGR